MKKHKYYYQPKKSKTKRVTAVPEVVKASTASELYQRSKDYAVNILERSSYILTRKNKQKDVCWLLDYPARWKLTH